MTLQENRISQLDAWRSICALGVLWIHSWQLCANQAINILGVDITKFLSVFGNGVDFFFAISGFCMYYFYADKLQQFNWKEIKTFLIRRWFRIAPVFYIGIAVYLFIGYWLFNQNISYQKILGNIFFINILSKSFEVAPHFWSIATEWQFYVILPVLFYMRVHSANYSRVLLVVTAVLFSIGVAMITLNKALDYQLPVRFIQFSTGIFAAYHLKNNQIRKNYGIAGFIFAVLVIGLGRLMNTETFLHYIGSDLYYALMKCTGYGLMSGGFSLLIYFSLIQDGIIYRMINTKLTSYLGKISYSFYIWHGIILQLTWIMMFHFFQDVNANFLILLFVLSALLTTGIASLSYYFIELKVVWRK